MNYLWFVILLCNSPSGSHVIESHAVPPQAKLVAHSSSAESNLKIRFDVQPLSRGNSFGFDEHRIDASGRPRAKQAFAAGKRREPRRHFDSKFVAVTAGVIAATAYEVESSQNCVRAGTCIPIVGKSRRQQYAIKLSLASAVIGITYFLKREDDQMADEADRKGWGGPTKVWWLPAVAYSSVFLARGIYNQKRLN